MRSYELMTIHRPELAESDVRSRIGEIEQALGSRGATMLETEFWGKRRLAYEINHLREGYYSVVSFQADAGVIPDVDRALSISDLVVRHKFIRTDERPGTTGADEPEAAVD